MSGDAWEGTGIVDSVNDAVVGISSGDYTMGEAVGFGLNALGFVANPFAGLLSVGIGWLIEHVPFLEEPLNDLAGDPDAIEAVAVTWAQEVRTELLGARDDYAAHVTAVRGGWTNEASEAYAVVAAQMGESIAGLEAASVGVADAVRGAGVAVATIRGVIRDLIADFVGEMVATWLAALAASWFTLGGSVGAFIANGVAKGTILAGRLGDKIGRLIQKLNDVIDQFGELGGLVRNLRRLSDSLADFARRAPQVGQDLGTRVYLGMDTATTSALRGLEGLNGPIDDLADVLGSGSPLGAGLRGEAYQDTQEDYQQDENAAEQEAQESTR